MAAAEAEADEAAAADVDAERTRQFYRPASAATVKITPADGLCCVAAVLYGKLLFYVRMPQVTRLSGFANGLYCTPVEAFNWRFVLARGLLCHLT